MLYVANSKNKKTMFFTFIIQYETSLNITLINNGVSSPLEFGKKKTSLNYKKDGEECPDS